MVADTPQSRERGPVAPGTAVSAQVGWTGVRRLWTHAALLTVILVSVLAVVDNGSIAVADEAVYATQAQALVDGSWTSPRPAPELDPTGTGVPLIDSTVVGGRIIAYSRHPLYPLVLVPAIALGGYSGGLIVSCLSTVGASICAAFLARRLDPRYGIPALWIAGCASPLVFDAVTLWGHGLVAASAGLTMLAALRIGDGGPLVRHVAYGIPAAVVTVLLRSEGVLFVLAVGAVMGASSIRVPIRAINPRVLGTAAVLGIVAVVSKWFDGRWASAVGGSGYGMNVGKLALAEHTDPPRAAWRTLLLPAKAPGLPLDRWVVTAAVCVVLAAIATRVLRRWRSVPWVLLVIAAGSWLGALATTAGEWGSMIAGLFVAWPFLTAALLMMAWSDLRRPDVARCLAVAVLTTAVLLLFLYQEGGATEWGGRFVHILIGPLVGPAILVFDQRARDFDGPERRAFVVPLLVVLMVPSVIAMSWVAQRKVETEREVGQLVATGERVTAPGERPLAVVWRVRPDGTSRFFWTVGDRIDVLNANSLANVFELLAAPSARRKTSFVLVTDLPPSILESVAEGLPHRHEWTMDSAATWSNDKINFVVFRANDR